MFNTVGQYSIVKRIGPQTIIKLYNTTTVVNKDYKTSKFSDIKVEVKNEDPTDELPPEIKEDGVKYGPTQVHQNCKTFINSPKDEHIKISKVNDVELIKHTDFVKKHIVNYRKTSDITLEKDEDGSFKKTKKVKRFLKQKVCGISPQYLMTAYGQVKASPCYETKVDLVCCLGNQEGCVEVGQNGKLDCRLVQFTAPKWERPKKKELQSLRCPLGTNTIESVEKHKASNEEESSENENHSNTKKENKFNSVEKNPVDDKPKQKEFSKPSPSETHRPIQSHKGPVPHHKYTQLREKARAEPMQNKITKTKGNTWQFKDRLKAMITNIFSRQKPYAQTKKSQPTKGRPVGHANECPKKNSQIPQNQVENEIKKKAKKMLRDDNFVRKAVETMKKMDEELFGHPKERPTSDPFIQPKCPPIDPFEPTKKLNISRHPKFPKEKYKENNIRRSREVFQAMTNLRTSDVERIEKKYWDFHKNPGYGIEVTKVENLGKTLVGVHTNVSPAPFYRNRKTLFAKSTPKNIPNLRKPCAIELKRKRQLYNHHSEKEEKTN